MPHDIVGINSCDHVSVFTSQSLNTRSSGARLVSAIGHTLTLSNNLLSRHINLRNSLPCDIKQIPSLATFHRKTNCLTFLLFSLVIFISIHSDHMFLIALYMCISVWVLLRMCVYVYMYCICIYIYIYIYYVYMY